MDRWVAVRIPTYGVKTFGSLKLDGECIDILSREIARGDKELMRDLRVVLSTINLTTCVRASTGKIRAKKRVDDKAVITVEICDKFRPKTNCKTYRIIVMP